MQDQRDMGDAAGEMAATAEGVTPPLDAEMERKIARERADLLYASPLPMVIAFILAAAMSVLLWGELPAGALLGWLALVGVAGLLRWRLRRAYFASDRDPPQAWLDRFARHVLGFGVLWSLPGVVMWVDQSPLLQGLVILVACGMASGSVASNSSHVPAVEYFVWPVFLVIVAGLAWQGDRIHLGLALIGIVYVVSLGLISRASVRTVTAAIRVKHEKEALVGRLGAALQEVEASGRAKTSFLATMSHELRTPLNAIIGFSEMLYEQRHGPLGSHQYRDYARDIYHSGKHLLDLVNDILDLTKIEAKRMELREEFVDAGELVPICCRMLRPKAEQGGVALETRILPGLNPLRADRAKLRQILFNLLSNAIKFTPSGGCVTVTAEPLAAGGIALTVTDTGIGLAPEDIPRALQPFRQIDNSLSRIHQGTGLGLPLAKALAELHGGTLAIESEPDRGTSVTVTFPPERVVAFAAIAEAPRPAAS
jgi:two-component system, cell cycle sensor histidine kinase PleC